MTLNELRETLQALDLKPSRKLGQNFLVDGNTLRRLVDEADAVAGDFVVEIGPGTGALTAQLIDRQVDLTAIEYDVRLAEYLRERFSDCPNFRLIQADAARFDFDDLTHGRAWRCSANLPYSVSTVILGSILDLKNLPVSMTLLLQREMAERICASKGSKTYGAMSVRIQTLYRASLVKVVPPTVFWPKPDVDSGILKLELRDSRPTPEQWETVNRLIRHCFQQRRKKIMNRLRAYAKLDWESVLEQLGISPDARPENLDRHQYMALACAILGDQE